ncbi:hypothetical protein ACJX0J_027291 [Zea mays]
MHDENVRKLLFLPCVFCFSKIGLSIYYGSQHIVFQYSQIKVGLNKTLLLINICHRTNIMPTKLKKKRKTTISPYTVYQYVFLNIRKLYLPTHVQDIPISQTDISDTKRISEYVDHVGLFINYDIAILKIITLYLIQPFLAIKNLPNLEATRAEISGSRRSILLHQRKLLAVDT